MKTYKQKWYEQNKEKYRAYNKKSYQKNRVKILKAKQAYCLKNASQIKKKRNERYAVRKKQIIAFLGDKCKHCGIKDIRVLQIDHINGGGQREIRQNKNLGTLNHYYRQMTANGDAFLKKYQLLCANCNWIKRFDKCEH